MGIVCTTETPDGDYLCDECFDGRCNGVIMPTGTDRGPHGVFTFTRDLELPDFSGGAE